MIEKILCFVLIISVSCIQARPKSPGIEERSQVLRKKENVPQINTMDSIEDPEERQIVEDEIKKNVRKVEGKTRKEIIKKYKNIIKEEVNKRVGEDAEHIKAKNSNDPMSTRPTYLGTWSNGHWKGIQAFNSTTPNPADSNDTILPEFFEVDNEEWQGQSRGNETYEMYPSL